MLTRLRICIPLGCGNGCRFEQLKIDGSNDLGFACASSSRFVCDNYFELLSIFQQDNESDLRMQTIDLHCNNFKVLTIHMHFQTCRPTISLQVLVPERVAESSLEASRVERNWRLLQRNVPLQLQDDNGKYL